MTVARAAEAARDDFASRARMEHDERRERLDAEPALQALDVRGVRAFLARAIHDRHGNHRELDLGPVRAVVEHFALERLAEGGHHSALKSRDGLPDAWFDSATAASGHPGDETGADADVVGDSAARRSPALGFSRRRRAASRTDRPWKCFTPTCTGFGGGASPGILLTSHPAPSPMGSSASTRIGASERGESERSAMTTRCEG